MFVYSNLCYMFVYSNLCYIFVYSNFIMIFKCNFITYDFMAWTRQLYIYIISCLTKDILIIHYKHQSVDVV